MGVSASPQIEQQHHLCPETNILSLSNGSSNEEVDVPVQKRGLETPSISGSTAFREYVQCSALHNDPNRVSTSSAFYQHNIIKQLYNEHSVIENDSKERNDYSIIDEIKPDNFDSVFGFNSQRHANPNLFPKSIAYFKWKKPSQITKKSSLSVCKSDTDILENLDIWPKRLQKKYLYGKCISQTSSVSLIENNAAKFVADNNICFLLNDELDNAGAQILQDCGSSCFSNASGSKSFATIKAPCSSETIIHVNRNHGKTQTMLFSSQQSTPEDACTTESNTENSKSIDLVNFESSDETSNTLIKNCLIGNGFLGNGGNKALASLDQSLDRRNNENNQVKEIQIKETGVAEYEDISINSLELEAEVDSDCTSVVSVFSDNESLFDGAN